MVRGGRRLEVRPARGSPSTTSKRWIRSCCTCANVGSGAPEGRFTSEQARGARGRTLTRGRQEIVDGLRGLRALPERPAAVTFDDGYADTFEVSYPILRRYAVHGRSSW